MKNFLYVILVLLLVSCNKNDALEDMENVNSYTITYSVNGATSGAPPSPLVVRNGTVVELSGSDSFSRDGYTFTCWNIHADGSGLDYAAGSKFTVTGHCTFYAKWRKTIVDDNELRITIGTSVFHAKLEDNATYKAFKAMLPLTIEMNELNGNEYYCYLSGSLPTSAISVGTVHAGDLMLFGSSCLVVFYKSFSTPYSYTKLGVVSNPSGLEKALGSGSSNIKIELKTE